MTSTTASTLPPSVCDRLENFIGGRWVRSRDGDRLAVVSPSTEEPVAQVVDGSPADADHAVRVARDAWSGWAARSVEERIALVRAGPTSWVG